MTAPLLQVDKIEVVYKRVITAVQGVNLSVEERQIVAVLGTNGAGKIRRFARFPVSSASTTRASPKGPLPSKARASTMNCRTRSPPGDRPRTRARKGLSQSHRCGKSCNTGSRIDRSDVRHRLDERAYHFFPRLDRAEKPDRRSSIRRRAANAAIARR